MNRSLARLALFQFGLGFSVVVFSGALNRVLINEEGVPASAVGWLLSLSLFVAPLRAIMGSRSDREKKTFGYRRLPYFWIGMMMIFAGLSAAPFSLLLLGRSSDIGQGVTSFPVAMVSSTFLFLMYAVGSHVAQTAYLALVTDRTPKHERSKAVAFLWMSLIVGQITSSLIIGLWLQDYHAYKLVQVMQTSAVVFLACSVVAIWKQDIVVVIEADESEDDFSNRVWTILGDGRIRLFFLIVFLGTIGLTEQDVLLEPYGGQVLGMTVTETTRLTAFWGVGMLIAMFVSSRVLPKMKSPLPLALVACGIGFVAFIIVIGVATVKWVPMLFMGAFTIGIANGFFLMSTLSLVVSLAEVKSAGLFVGMWGLSQTTATGLSNVLGGAIRDLFTSSGDVARGYTTAYGIEMMMLIVTFVLLIVMPRNAFASRERGQSAFAGLTDIPGG